MQEALEDTYIGAIREIEKISESAQSLSKAFF